jgi:hypothetical protein
VGQYTDKINAIAEDFATLEYYEKVSALEARDGMMIIHYNHGGKEITSRKDSEYEGYKVKLGETVIIPPTDKEYKRLKERYTTETWGSSLGKLWKRITNRTVNLRDDYN